MTHQIDINDLEFAEKRYGKLIGWVPGAIDEKGKINPQVTKGVREDGKFVSVFHVKPVYYETPTGHWRPLSEVTLHHGNHKIVMNENWWKVHPRYLNWLDKRCKLIGGELLIPSSIRSYPTPYTGIVRSLHESLVPLKMGLTTSTFYPDPNAETTTVDGHIGYDNSSYATARTAATGNSVSDSGTGMEWQNTEAGTLYVIKRNATLFDTSAITDTDNVDSATYSQYITAGTNPQSVNLILVSCNPTSNTALATTDFDITKWGSTSFGSIVMPTTSLNQYYNWTVNSSGLSAISKTGVTKYGIRISQDVDGVAPGNEQYNQGGAASADTAGTGSDPKLVIVHTAGVTSTPYKILLLGVG